MLERNENFLTTRNPAFLPALYLAPISSPNGNNLQDPNYWLTAQDRRGNGTVKCRKEISSVLCGLSCLLIHVRQWLSHGLVVRTQVPASDWITLQYRCDQDQLWTDDMGFNATSLLLCWLDVACGRHRLTDDLARSLPIQSQIVSKKWTQLQPEEETFTVSWFFITFLLLFCSSSKAGFTIWANHSISINTDFSSPFPLLY